MVTVRLDTSRSRTDAAPRFERDRYVFSVPENRPPSVVGVVRVIPSLLVIVAIRFQSLSFAGIPCRLILEQRHPPIRAALWLDSASIPCPCDLRRSHQRNRARPRDQQELRVQGGSSPTSLSTFDTVILTVRPHSYRSELVCLRIQADVDSLLWSWLFLTSTTTFLNSRPHSSKYHSPATCPSARTS